MLSSCIGGYTQSFKPHMPEPNGHLKCKNGVRTHCS